jgi:hypothetical protein
MSRVVGVLCVYLVLTGVLSGARATSTGNPNAPGDTNQAPLPEAGLDQTITRGRKAYLDASGSTDPDGTIVAYDWTVQTPDGTTVAVDCHNCTRTTFRPRELGTYEVSLGVTDDANRTRRDTFFVNVTRGTGPTVSLQGQDGLAPGTTTTYVADVRAGTAPLESVTWTLQNSTVATEQVSNGTARAAVELAFPSPGVYLVRARAKDAVGRTANETLPVRVGGSVPSGTSTSGNVSNTSRSGRPTATPGGGDSDPTVQPKEIEIGDVPDPITNKNVLEKIDDIDESSEKYCEPRSTKGATFYENLRPHSAAHAFSGSSTDPCAYQTDLADYEMAVSESGDRKVVTEPDVDIVDGVVDTDIDNDDVSTQSKHSIINRNFKIGANRNKKSNNQDNSLDKTKGLENLASSLFDDKGSVNQEGIMVP